MSDPIVCLRQSVLHQWAGGPHGWIIALSPQHQHVIGERLVAGFFAAKGLDVMRSPDYGARRVIEGKRTKIISSILGRSGTYTFQRMRDQNYEYLICFGISPFSTHCWVIPKHLARRHAPGQHTGRSARDTRWLTVNPNDVPRWLSRWGGTLRKACVVLQAS